MHRDSIGSHFRSLCVTSLCWSLMDPFTRQTSCNKGTMMCSMSFWQVHRSDSILRMHPDMNCLFPVKQHVSPTSKTERISPVSSQATAYFASPPLATTYYSFVQEYTKIITSVLLGRAQRFIGLCYLLRYRGHYHFLIVIINNQEERHRKSATVKEADLADTILSNLHKTKQKQQT